MSEFDKDKLDAALEKIQKGVDSIPGLEEKAAKVPELEKSVTELSATLKEVKDEIVKMKTEFPSVHVQKSEEEILSEERVEFVKMCLKKLPYSKLKNGERIRERQLKFAEENHLDHLFVKAINEETDSEGRYVIPVEYSNKMIETGLNYGILRRFGTIIPMTRDKLNMEAMADLEAYVESPGTANTNSQTPVFSQVQFDSKRVETLIYINEEWYEDVNPSVVNFLMNKIGRAIAKREDWLAFRADGTSDIYDGGLTGLLNNSSIASVVTSTTAFTSATWANASSMIDGVVDDISGQGRFLFHKALRGHFRGLAATSYETPFLADGPDVDSFWGYPVSWSNVFPSAASSGGSSEAFGIYGDLSQVGLGDRRVMTMKLDTSVKFIESQYALKVNERIDVKCLNTNAFTRLISAAV